jgi:hypothetical protein
VDERPSDIRFEKFGDIQAYGQANQMAQIPVREVIFAVVGEYQLSLQF